MPSIMMNLRHLAAWVAAANLLQKVAGFAAESLMQPEVGPRMSAGYSEPGRA